MEILSHARYLFLFAHPDDDVLIAGTMRTLLDRCADITCCWATSGGIMGGGARREEELHDAMEILGLERDRRRLLRHTDSRVTTELDRFVESTADLIREISPDAIVADAFEGGHPDHDSVNFAAYEAKARAGSDARLYEFPLYNGSGPLRHWRWRINDFPPGGPPTRFTELNDDAIRTKHAMMRAYASQRFYMAFARKVTSPAVMRMRGEPYRLCPEDRDHAARPHPGKLNYERWFSAFLRTKFEDFQAAVYEARGRS